MPNKQNVLTFQTSLKMCEDIEYLVRELNHENLSKGSMLKTNKSEVLRQLVSVGLASKIRELRARKIAELNEIVGNQSDFNDHISGIRNLDIQNRSVTVTNPNIYNQAKEAYSNGCND